MAVPIGAVLPKFLLVLSKLVVAESVIRSSVSNLFTNMDTKSEILFSVLFFIVLDTLFIRDDYTPDNTKSRRCPKP